MANYSREAFTFFRNSFESTSGSFFITNPISMILYGNKALLRKRKYNLPQIVGKKPGDVWGGCMSKDFYRDFWHTISIKKQPFVGRINNVNSSGVEVVEDVCIAPLCKSNGEIDYFIEVSPTIVTVKKYQFFQVDFLEYWRSAVNNDINSFCKIVFWLGEDKHVSESLVKKYIHILNQEGYTLNDIIKDIFIEPTENILMNRLEDHVLIKAAQHDSEAFIDLYLKYYTSIFYYFIKRLDNYSLAEDFTQETFLRAYTSLARFKIINSSYYTFLKRISHNILINHYRKSERIYENSLLLSLTSIDEHTGINDIVDSTFLWKSIDALPENYRDVIIKKYREYKSIKEIAREYNKTENAIKLILSRARKALRKMLKM